jgi:hypothetical protein
MDHRSMPGWTLGKTGKDRGKSGAGSCEEIDFVGLSVFLAPSFDYAYRNGSD